MQHIHKVLSDVKLSMTTFTFHESYLNNGTESYIHCVEVEVIAENALPVQNGKSGTDRHVYSCRCKSII